jgi:threonine/homoserine/homoserine lactone efflux protein
MTIAMNLKKVLSMTSMVIAGVLGVVFLLDLAVGMPFGRSDVVTDVLVIVAAALLIWQGVETWLEF